MAANRQRNRLLVGFLAGSLLVIALFSAIAYTSARDYHWHQIPHLLQDHSQQLLATLPERPTLEQIQKLLPEYETAHDALLLLDAEGRVVPSPQGSQSLPPVPSEQLSQPEGQFQQDDARYIWVTRAIPGTPYRLVTLHRAIDGGLAEFVRYVGVPMGFATLLGVWAAVWGALIVGSLFERLDRQRYQLQHQAAHDPLTDLPNRDTLGHAIDAAIQTTTDRRPLAVCLVDLQAFKEINDSLGHTCGDELLRQVASRLRSVVHAPDAVGRFYGNKFAVLLQQQDASTVEDIGERLLGVLEPAFTVDDRSLFIRGTLGIAFHPQHAEDAAGLLQRAETATFQARSGNRPLAVYQETDNDAAARRLGLANDLRNALHDEQLNLYYQSKLDLRTGRVIGAEALARWIHPEHGFIPPDQFVDIAERTGLIKQLTAWVLQTTVRRAAECRAHGRSLKFSANLSAINLHDEELVPMVARLLEEHRLPPPQLVLEVTETAMMLDPDHAREQLNRLDALGVHISIDDFGTGYSSLGHLRQLPVDEIKIDKSFVMDMNANEDDASIVRATIGLAHDLNLQVVAEGVEDADILNNLRAMGCDIAQGYHIARPLPEADFIAFVQCCETENGAKADPDGADPSTQLAGLTAIQAAGD